MKKKLFSLALCAIMVVALAVPAFADWTLVPYRAASNSNNHLNIYGASGAPMGGRALSLWYTTAPGFDQNFTVNYTSYGGTPCMYLQRSQSGTFTINRASYSASGGKSAIMWNLTDGARDSAFKMPRPDETQLVNLLNYNEGLAYTGDYSGATIYFNAGGSSGWLASGSPAL